MDVPPARLLERLGVDAPALARELTDASVNLALAYARRARWEPLRWDGVDADAQLLRFERLATEGHPLHPCGRTRLGWRVPDLLAHDQESAGTSVGFVAVRRDLHVGDDVGSVPDCMRPAETDPPVALMDDSPDPFADLSAGKRKIADLVVKAAPQFKVDPRLALAIIATESNFQPEAQSPKDARGLMQLMSATAARFKVRNRLDIKDNVQGGLAYLRWLLAYYEGRVTLTVAAYNAGEAAVDKYSGVPPYPETRDYVRRVRRLFPDERHSFDPGVAGPSPILVRSTTDSSKGAP